MFHIGDKVKLIANVDHCGIGCTGTIFCEYLHSKSYQWGVVVDKPFSGCHSLDGKLGIEHFRSGYWVPESAIEHLYQELKYDPTQQPDEEDDV